jgi:hypothetical protein
MGRITSNSMFYFDLLLLPFSFGPHQASRNQQRLFTTSSTTVDHCNDFSLPPPLGRPRAALRASPRARPRSPRAAAGRRQPNSASAAAIGTWPLANAALLRTKSPAEAAGGDDEPLLSPPVRERISLRTRGWREWSGKAAESARSFPPSSSSLFSPLAAVAAAAAAADALPVGFRGSGSAETYEEEIPYLYSLLVFRGGETGPAAPEEEEAAGEVRVDKRRVERPRGKRGCRRGAPITDEEAIGLLLLLPPLHSLCRRFSSFLSVRKLLPACSERAC